jgi:hypothetical protein
MYYAEHDIEYGIENAEAINSYFIFGLHEIGKENFWTFRAKDIVQSIAVEV